MRKWHCTHCEVTWHGFTDTCWMCDRRGTDGYVNPFRPALQAAGTPDPVERDLTPLAAAAAGLPDPRLSP